ncbi:hypothetical protein [Photobacterium sp. 1_MG-2023]|uniref:hypothetical protein n=1 Tax=Photobacterium sp. 1_MG-2023 TaxID=3062646 RepID=UPI0026E21CDD|nr:hypothetical protein [Photobacterium sp. 1_MG-2023]MDO6708996.1 hypothetical protein [Photobacterium sp. 1_MG-2023]
MVTFLIILGFIFIVVLAFRGVILANMFQYQLGLKKGALEVYYIVQVEAFTPGDSIFILDNENKVSLYKSCVNNIRYMYFTIFLVVLMVFIHELT